MIPTLTFDAFLNEVSEQRHRAALPEFDRERGQLAGTGTLTAKPTLNNQIFQKTKNQKEQRSVRQLFVFYNAADIVI